MLDPSWIAVLLMLGYVPTIVFLIRSTRSEVAAAEARAKARGEALAQELRAEIATFRDKVNEALGRIEPTMELHAARAQAHVAELLDAYAKQSAAAIMAGKSARVREDQQLEDVALNGVILQVLQQVLPEHIDSAKVVDVAMGSAIGKTLLAQARGIVGENPEAALQLLAPFIQRVAGGLKLSGRGGGRAVSYQ